MRAYYNEIDPAAAHILTWLIGDGVIADGDVDTRSIADVHPSDLAGYTQAHFFAGGGLWSVAARLAGWADDRPLWTGGCPCQPFSVAGKGAGENDPRHLWPHFFRLIRACRPSVVMGEQVAGSAGYRWFDGVAADLEREDYASRAVDIPACAVDAPHIRQRLYWCAVADAAGGNAIAERIQRGGVDGFQPQGGCDRGDARNAERATPADACRRLPTTAATWPTPTVNDSRNGANATATRNNPCSKHHSGTTLVDATRLSGQTQNGSPEQTAKRGVLNPEFVFWLMGFPKEWQASASRAMQLFRKWPQRSSAP